MKIVDILIEQCKNPSGILGTIMIKIMEAADSGFNKWVQQFIDESRSNILDVGCGGGKTIKRTAKRHERATVYGIDISAHTVKVAKKKNSRKVRKGSVIIQQSNVENLPFIDNFFDTVTAIRTHYFWKDLEASLTEIYRVLKDKGQLLIISDHYNVTYHMEKHKSTVMLQALLTEIGFTTFQLHENDRSFCLIAEK
jgi:ubiquinone/menaquinone biosynthesis C-methylase UbiE